MTDENNIRFRFDAKPVDIGTFVELHLNGGMAFYDSEEKAAYFRRAAANPTSVDYGASLSHARATNLGIFGGSGALYEDCAKIMAAELQRFQIERGETPTVSYEQLSDSRIFRQAFQASREPKEAALHNLVRALGDNDGHMDSKVVKTGPQVFRGLHDAVLEEISKYRGRTPYEDF